MTYIDEQDAGEAFRFAINVANRWNRTRDGILPWDELPGIAGEVVARDLPAYDPGRGIPLQPFLATKVRHACVDEVRRHWGRDHSGDAPRRINGKVYPGRDGRRVHVPFDPDEHDRAVEDPSGEVAAAVDVDRFLAGMGRQQREVVQARLAGAQNREIGRRWGVDHVRISRIMRDVRSRYHTWSGAGA